MNALVKSKSAFESGYELMAGRTYRLKKVCDLQAQDRNETRVYTGLLAANFASKIAENIAECSESLIAQLNSETPDLLKNSHPDLHLAVTSTNQGKTKINYREAPIVTFPELRLQLNDKHLALRLSLTVCSSTNRSKLWTRVTEDLSEGELDWDQFDASVYAISQTFFDFYEEKFLNTIKLANNESEYRLVPVLEIPVLGYTPVSETSCEVAEQLEVVDAGKTILKPLLRELKPVFDRTQPLASLDTKKWVVTSSGQGDFGLFRKLRTEFEDHNKNVVERLSFFGITTSTKEATCGSPDVANTRVPFTIYDRRL